MYNNTETEEATSMEANTEAIGIEAQSGLLNHVVGFHAKGAVASKSMEEETNKVVNSKSTFEKEEENDENTTNMENSEEKGGTVDGNKEQTVGVEKPMKDEWEFDDSKEDDIMDGKQGKTEELADVNEKARDTEDDKNTNRYTIGKDKENGEEIKPSNVQEKPKNQEMDEGHVASEAAMKENTTEENEDTEEEETKENNMNTTNNPDTGGLLLFVVRGTRNENKQKDRTNIITSLSMESKTEEEQEH